MTQCNGRGAVKNYVKSVTSYVNSPLLRLFKIYSELLRVDFVSVLLHTAEMFFILMRSGCIASCFACRIFNGKLWI